jgi:putative DNA primase/helicase
MIYHSPRNPVTLAKQVLLSMPKPAFIDGSWWQWVDDRWVDASLGMRLKILEACATARQAPRKEGDEPTPYPTTKTALSDVEECMRRMAEQQWAYGSWTEDDDWSDVDTIATVEGLYHVGTGEMRPAEYAFFEPRLFPFMPRPGPIDVLEEIMESQGFDEDERDHLQEVLGYLLSKDTWAHKAFALCGLPRSGKGTLIRLLVSILGDLVVSSSPRALSEQFGLAGLMGKTVCVLNDVRDWYTKEAKGLVENVLRVTGEDDVEIRAMRKVAYTARLRARFVFSSNPIPSFDDSTGVIAGRFRVVQFRRSFLGSEDPTLEARLTAQAPAIAHWAFEGLRKLRETRQWTETKAQAEMLEQIRHACNPVLDWLDSATEPDLSGRVSRDELWASYELWTLKNGIKRTLSRPGLYRVLREHGFTETKLAGVRQFTGLRMLTAEPSWPI